MFAIITAIFVQYMRLDMKTATVVSDQLAGGISFVLFLFFLELWGKGFGCVVSIQDSSLFIISSLVFHLSAVLLRFSYGHSVSSAKKRCFFFKINFLFHQIEKASERERKREWEQHKIINETKRGKWKLNAQSEAICNMDWIGSMTKRIEWVHFNLS